MRLAGADCRRHVAGARVARLATTDHAGRPHLVPITFALTAELAGEDSPADLIVTAVDQKPKSTTDLARLRNIRANPAVAVLCDHYSDDWTRLWWVRADGTAAILADGNERDEALSALAAKYPQYQADPPRGPVVAITVTRWSGWSAAPPR